MSGREQKVGRLKAMATHPQALRHGMNLWPPFLSTGIRVLEMSADFRRVRVQLRRLTATTNYVGTLFGGSLFAMTDPFWMIMLMRNLGPGYVVWDKAAEIDFVSPGRESVTATFELTQGVVDEVVEAVATIRKQIYVRLER